MDYGFRLTGIIVSRKFDGSFRRFIWAAEGRSTQFRDIVCHDELKNNPRALKDVQKISQVRIFNI